MQSNVDLGVGDELEERKEGKRVLSSTEWTHKYADDFDLDDPKLTETTPLLENSQKPHTYPGLPFHVRNKFSNRVYLEEIKLKRHVPRKRKQLSLVDEDQTPSACSSSSSSVFSPVKKQQYRGIVATVVSCYTEPQGKGKIIDAGLEQKIIANLCDIAELDVEQITDKLINAARDLRCIANETAKTAKAGWGNSCLSFFSSCCCPSSPVQYHESRLYILIGGALRRAQQQQIIKAINLDQLSDPTTSYPVTKECKDRSEQISSPVLHQSP